MFLLAVLAAAPPALAGDEVGSGSPYAVITKDGHRIDVLEKPVLEGGKARMRLSPRGALAVIAADAIDWPATEEFNAPPPPPRPEPPVPIPEPEAAAPGKVIEMTIIGSRRGVSVGPPAAPAAGIWGVDPNQAADFLAALSREMGNLRSLHERLLQSKVGVEAEIAGLTERLANVAQVSSLEDYQTPSQRALGQATARLQTVTEQIDTLERRMNEIRAQAIGLGRSLD